MTGLPPGVTDGETDGPHDPRYTVAELLDATPATIIALAEAELYVAGRPRWVLADLVRADRADEALEALTSAWSVANELAGRGFTIGAAS